MKLRFRGNSLRLRVNQREVQTLAAGIPVNERVIFPGNAGLEYVLVPSSDSAAQVSFDGGTIRVAAPDQRLADWANGQDIGLYFDFPAGSVTLKVAIEKDLECVDGPLEERDPEAFPRSGKNC